MTSISLTSLTTVHTILDEANNAASNCTVKHNLQDSMSAPAILPFVPK